MSGISELIKELNEQEKRHDGFVGEAAFVLCNLLGGDVSSEEFQLLSIIMKQFFVSL